MGQQYKPSDHILADLLRIAFLHAVRLSECKGGACESTRLLQIPEWFYPFKVVVEKMHKEQKMVFRIIITQFVFRDLCVRSGMLKYKSK